VTKPGCRFCVCSVLCCFFCVPDEHVAHVVFVLGLVSSVLRREIGYEEQRQNDPFCVEWDVIYCGQSVLLRSSRVALLYFVRVFRYRCML